MVWDHQSLCAQVPYEGLLQPRGFGVAAQVMMSVERGQVYFGKCHTSDLISPLHETHSWLLLAWPLPRRWHWTVKATTYCFTWLWLRGRIYNLPANLQSLNRTKTWVSSCCSWVMYNWKVERSRSRYLSVILEQKMVARPTEITVPLLKPIFCFTMIKVSNLLLYLSATLRYLNIRNLGNSRWQNNLISRSI